MVNCLNLISYIKIPGLPEPYNQKLVRLVKTPEGLFGLVDFSGMVYRLDTVAGGFSWQRMDRTVFGGYNGGNLVFYANNHIYSFGGGGLWQITGHLRYYLPEKYEWELQQLNREIPFLSDFRNSFWVDQQHGHLYILGRKLPTPTLLNNDSLYRDIVNKVWRLELSTGQWVALGTSPDTAFLQIANSPWGLMYIDKQKPRIVDYRNNRYLKGTEATIRKMARYSRGVSKSLIFFRDSTLIFGNMDGYLDSVAFSSRDFISTGIPVYTPLEQDRSAGNTMLLAGGLLAALGLTIFYRKRLLRSVTPLLRTTEAGGQGAAAASDSAAPTYSPLTLLDERERSLLAFLLQRTLAGGTVTIEALNRQLGVQHKNIEIQKKQRSETINAINQKLASVTGIRLPAIDKVRGAEDKRSFEYFIREEFREVLQGTQPLS